MRIIRSAKPESLLLDAITKATNEGVDPEIQSRLAEMGSRKQPIDTIPIPLDEEALARQTRLRLLKDEIAELQTRLGDLKVKASKAGNQAADAAKTGAK